MGGEYASGGAARGRLQATVLSRLASGFKRRWRWVFLSALAAMLVSSAFVLIATPRYTGVAKVLLEDRESYHTRPDRPPGFDPTATIGQDAIQSQAETAATADLARKAIDKLALASNPEFRASASRDPEGKADQRVVDKFLSRLTVFPVPRSRVLQIEFVSRDPELAARGANTVADLYLQLQAETKANAARAAGAGLSLKVEELRAKVADADARLEAFRAQPGLLSGSDGQTVSGPQPSDLSAQLASARSAQAAAAAKAELLRKLEIEGRLDEAPDSITDASVRRFAEQRLALRAQIAEAARALLPLHPHVKELVAQLASLDGQIRDAAAKNVRILENDARLAGDQVASLSATLAQQTKIVALGDADDVRLRALDAEAKAAREQLGSYLQRYREATARDADDAALADTRVISAAEPPRSPTFPKAWQTIALATLATFVFSIGVAGASTLLSGEADPTAARMGPLTSEAASALTPVAHQPGVDASRMRDLAPSAASDRGPDRHDGREPGATLADRLTRARTPGCGQVVLITGHRCGQTLAIALDTARRLSAHDSTLLVDLGAAQDWFADIIDREEAGEVEVSGLADLLAGRAGFGEIIRRDLSSNVDVIPSGGDLTDVETLEDVFDALASSYDRVFVHASDWRSPAARTAANCADVIVIAAPEARLQRALEAAKEAVGGAGSKFIPLTAKQAASTFDDAA